MVNGRLDAASQLYIHDDVQALRKIKDLPDYVCPIIGPNLFINPEDIPDSLSLGRSVYIHPSDNVIRIWKKKGYGKTALDVWPAGVDTERYKPDGRPKKEVILYFKQRTSEELAAAEAMLEEKNIPYRLFRYGYYKEEDFCDALLDARYLVWLGGFESQGLALEETLSSGVPVLVVDKKPSSSFEEGATAAPYWSDECGLRISDINLLSATLDEMERSLPSFNPRNYIEQNLNLEKQAEALIALYDKHFGITFEQGLSESPRSAGRWKPSQLIRNYSRLKRLLGRLFI